jgi:magnesium and cobalt exporter, CNNM family
VSAALFIFAIILGLLLANAVFVAGEFAIVGVPRPSIERLASLGNRLARRVIRILDSVKRRDRYLATTQIGVSLASLGLGMYGEHVVAESIAAWLEPLNVSRWVAAHTVQGAERTAMLVSPAIEAIEKAILPLVIALDALRALTVRAIGISGEVAEEERYHSTEELQLIIQESQEEGLLRGESGRILRELFEFGDLKAWQVMVPRVHLVAVRVGTTADELRDIVRTRPHTRFPVHTGDPDNIVGMVHIKDVLRHIVLQQPVAMGDARPVLHIPATTPLDEVLSAMRRARAQMAVVMDEQGGTAGIVTIEDLFEEVVGEIDEGRGRTPIWRDATGRLLVRGTVRLKDAAEAIGRPLEHPDVQTISGLVLTLLGRPASVGDVVTWNGVRIEVTGVSGRGVADTALTYRTPPRTDG